MESYCAFVEILVSDYERLGTSFRETAGMSLVLRERDLGRLEGLVVKFLGFLEIY
jgi:hypothetical protein